MIIFKYSAACLIMAAASLHAQTISLPAPRGDEVDITRILAARHETAAFATNGLPRQTVSDILWASTGINRPATGHRTSNYSFASRDNEIYLLCNEGVFLYDQINHALTQESTNDLRSTLPAPADTAPITLALVTYSSSVNFFGAIHTGFISENIALACTDHEIGAHVSNGIPASLSTDLGLASGHNILLLQTIGYPEGSTPPSTAWTVAAGPLYAAAVSDAPALKILKRRRSTKSFTSTPFSDQTLAEVLWAGAGVNNSNTQERTAPRISGVDEIDIYVARSNGVFVYRPAFGSAHTIELVSSNDIRSSIGYSSVPAFLIYVADYSLLTGTSSEKQRAACLHAGHISQNIAAYVAAEGIGEYVRSSVSVSATTLGLTGDQSILFTQTLGYPNSGFGASTIAFAAGNGGSVSGSVSQSIAFGGGGTPVVAVPEDGNYFSYWEGMPGGRVLANPLSLEDVTCPMTVTAVFSNAPSTYAGWASAGFTPEELLDANISGSDADPDDVGLANFERYAYGLAARGPAAPVMSLSNVVAAEEHFFTLTFNRRANGNDLLYIVEDGASLSSWNTLATYSPGLPAAVTAEYPITTNETHHFLRLKLSAE